MIEGTWSWGYEREVIQEEIADLERFYPYLARKTAARTIRDSDSIEAASATLGHSSTAVTVKHYAGAVHDAPDVSTALEGFLRGSL